MLHSIYVTGKIESKQWPDRVNNAKPDNWSMEVDYHTAHRLVKCM